MSEFLIDSAYYEEQRRACTLLGVAVWSEDTARREDARHGGKPDPRLTEAHEAGHALATLIHGGPFAFVQSRPTGVLVHWDDTSPSRIIGEDCSFEARVAIGAGGMVAEEILFGEADPIGASRDAWRVLARHGITMDTLDHERAREAREQVARLRELFRGEFRPPLITLARSLRTEGRLTRDRCVELLKTHHGIHVGPDVSAWLSPLDEIARVREADARLKARQDGLRLDTQNRLEER